MYYKRKKLDNESDKDVVTKEIISVTSVIEKVRKEIRMCDEVYYNVLRMKEQIKETDNKEKIKKARKTKEKDEKV